VVLPAKQFRVLNFSKFLANLFDFLQENAKEFDDISNPMNMGGVSKERRF
jgi:hypothetical protein